MFYRINELKNHIDAVGNIGGLRSKITFPLFIFFFCGKICSKVLPQSFLKINPLIKCGAKPKSKPLFFILDKDKSNFFFSSLNRNQEAEVFVVEKPSLKKILFSLSFSEIGFLCKTTIQLAKILHVHLYSNVHLVNYVYGHLLALRAAQIYTPEVLMFSNTRNSIYWGVSDGLQYLIGTNKHCFFQKYVAGESQKNFFHEGDKIITTSPINGNLYTKIKNDVRWTNLFYLADLVYRHKRVCAGDKHQDSNLYFWIGQERHFDVEYTVIAKLQKLLSGYFKNLNFVYVTRSPSALHEWQRIGLEAIGLSVIETNKTIDLMPNGVFGGFSNLLCSFALANIPTYSFLCYFEGCLLNLDIIEQHLSHYNVKQVDKIENLVQIDLINLKNRSVLKISEEQIIEKQIELFKKIIVE